MLDDKDLNKFVAKMGADAVRDLLERIQLDEMSYRLRDQAANETFQAKKG